MKKLSSFFQLKLLTDGFCFALAKGTAFLIPLLAVRLMALSDYGFLETSFAWAQQLAAVFGLGLAGAYPFFILKKQETAMQFHFLAYGIILLIFAGLDSLLFLSGILPKQPYFILLITLLLVSERILSAMLKTHNSGKIAVLVDSLYYFGLAFALLLLCCRIVPQESFFTGLSLILLLLIILLGIRYGVLLKKHLRHFRGKISLQQAKSLLKFSIPLIFSGLIIYWLVACSRIYLSILLGNETVGIYSFCFRFFAIAILLYQFAYIMFFRKLYIVGTQLLDRNFSLLLGIVFASSLLCLAAFPVFRRFFPSVQYGKLLLVALELGCFMPVWCGTALNEGIIARENQVIKMNLFLLPQLVLFPLIIYLLRTKITLEAFCTLHLISCSLVFFSQAFILAKKNVKLIKSSIIVAAVTLCGVLSFICLHQ